VIRGLAALALVLVATRALADTPDLDTLVVPEPPALVARKPTEDIRRLLRPEASIIEARNRLDRNIVERTKSLAELSKLEGLVDQDLKGETKLFEARSAALDHDRQLVKTRLERLAESARTSPLADLFARPAGKPDVSPSAAVVGKPDVSPSAAVAGKPDVSPSAAVAGKPSFGLFEERRSARELLAVADRERIRVYAASVSDWEVAKADLLRRTQNLARTKETIRRLEQELAWDREEQAALLAAVVAEPEFYAAYAQEMEKLDEVVAAKVKALSAAAPADRKRMYMEETRGGLSTPIRNTDLVGGFGTRNYKGIRSVWRGAHFYPMRAPAEGERVDVRAVYWGWVAWTGWLPGLGQVVILDHTVGYTSLYAHLASIDVTVGAKVKTGEVLGAMGDTESFFGKRLYMELRRDGVALDPLPWMR